MNNSFMKKIDSAIEVSKLRIQKIEKQKDDISNIVREKINGQINNPEEYRRELENYNYELLVKNNMITRFQLYIERFEKYKIYLINLEKDNDILKNHDEFDFIKKIQEEYIFYINSMINEREQRKTIEKSYEKLNLEIEEINKKKNEVYNQFINGEFRIKQEKIYTSDYLDFDIEKVVSSLYPSLLTKKGKRK